MSKHYYPEIYVKGGETGGKTLCKANGVFYISPEISSCEEVYSIIPFEEILKFIDLEKGAILRDLVMVTRINESLKAYYVPANTPICVQEITGRNIYVFAIEGSHIKKGEKIAYIITGKREVRNVYSLCEGFILACVDVVWEKPEKVIMVVLCEQPRELVIGEGAGGSL